MSLLSSLLSSSPLYLSSSTSFIFLLFLFYLPPFSRFSLPSFRFSLHLLSIASFSSSTILLFLFHYALPFLFQLPLPPPSLILRFFRALFPFFLHSVYSPSYPTYPTSFLTSTVWSSTLLSHVFLVYTVLYVLLLSLLQFYISYSFLIAFVSPSY